MEGENTVRVEDPDPPGERVTVDGLRESVGPEGEMIAARDRLPDSPLMLVKAMVELEEDPGGTDRDVELGEILKSTIWTVTWIE